ncbi:MAG: YbhB/YbcL family Raf kinase inhibitor-like protein [Candidatus Vogelbacteria bacterium]|nr:YbhB/YbcL family Raf kinase inhibitor-like protein [Candidatus Vogelbacteria bacterium]
MTIKSSSFIDGGQLPKKYSCDGNKINPPLEFSNIPQRTKSLALIVEDPDAPQSSYAPDGVWVHWLVWNIDPKKNKIEEGEIGFGVVGSNSSGKQQYYPPCPPGGEHRYIFKLYALDIILDFLAGGNKTELLKAMDKHILDTAETFGRYTR